MEKNNGNSSAMRVHINFKKRVEKFIEEFLAEKGVEITPVQATKIIDDKIKQKGGLVVT